ncbi:MAG: hypothetical protein O7I42_01855 [Alphaproteobacteria bacterium]|nr:hypothetical protein [Alphaproteobacteria bacterium]
MNYRYFVVAALCAGFVGSNADADDINVARLDSGRWAHAYSHFVQTAAETGRLSGPRIKALLTGRSVRMERQRGAKTYTLTLRFGDDGSFRHGCTAIHQNARTQGNIQCRVTSATGRWMVNNDNVCIQTGRRRCFFVVRQGGGHAFQSPKGRGGIYKGSFSVE